MRGTTVTGNTSKAMERHIGSSYKNILLVANSLEQLLLLSSMVENGSITNIADNIDDIIVVSSSIDDVITVAGIKNDVVTVATIKDDVVTVSTNINSILEVKDSLVEITRVSQSADNIDRVYQSINNLDRVYQSIDNVDIVAEQTDKIDTVASIDTQVVTVANSIAEVTTVATNISDVNDVSDNMADVKNASQYVDDIQANVASAANSASSAAQSAQESEQSNVASSDNAYQTNQDKLAITAMRDEVETNKTEVAANTAQSGLDAAQTSADVIETTSLAQEAEDNKNLAKQWAVGDSGSGNDVPSDTNSAYAYAKQAENSATEAAQNASHTFVSKGLFTPTAVQEYPDLTDVTTDTKWIIKFDNEGETYEYTTGDITGTIVKNGFELVYLFDATTFDYVPVSHTGVGSVNGVNPDASNDVSLSASNFPDIYSKTETNTITDDLQNQINDSSDEITINAGAITSLNTSVANLAQNKADVGSVYTQGETDTLLNEKQDADVAVTKTSPTGSIIVPAVTTANQETTSTALISFNPDTKTFMGRNPITGEWGEIGGGESYSQMLPYSPTRTYKQNETCTTFNTTTGELEIWTSYAPSDNTGHNPQDPANRHDDWANFPTPCWWIKSHAVEAGTPVYWFSDDIPENALQVMDTDIDAGFYHRIAKAYPSLVADGKINLAQILGRYIRIADGADYVVNTTHEDAIRNINGSLIVADNSANVGGIAGASGAFSLSGNSGLVPDWSTGSTSGSRYANTAFDASDVVPTASQNQPQSTMANLIIFI